MDLFQSIDIIGLDISDYSIEVAQVDRKKRVALFGRGVLEPGIVASGKILDKPRLAEQIKRVLVSTRPKSLAKVKSLKAIVSLPETRIFTHRFEIDQSIKGENLKNAVYEEVLKIFPFDLQKSSWDYLVFPPKIALNSKINPTQTPLAQPKNTIVYFALPKDIAVSYFEVMQNADLVPYIFESESQALGRIMLQEEQHYKGGTAILDIGSKNTILAIFDSRKALSLSVTIPIGGWDFSEEIAKAKGGISIEDAEQDKCALGFNQNAPDNAIRPILEKMFEKIIAETKKSISYYTSVFRESVDSLVICGGSSMTPDIDVFFRENLDGQFPVNVQLASLDDKVVGSKGFLNDKNVPAILFSVAVGLAMRALDHDDLTHRGINFLKRMK